MERKFWGCVLGLSAMMFLPFGAVAGSLEPSAAPGPTMKTLDDVPPTWDQQITGAQRFQVIWNNTAALDKETGLVWEQSPDDMTGYDYADAITHCLNNNVGGRKGWRLPTAEELASLVDPSVASGIALPSGHPFNMLQNGYFWSATTYVIDSNVVWNVAFNVGNVARKVISNPAVGLEQYAVWCVRGGKGD